MILASVLAVLVAPSVVSAQAPLAPPTNTQDTLIEIDGAKDPTAIPDYLAWRHAFRVLTKNQMGRRHITLSPSDDALLETAIEAERRRDGACQARQERPLTSLTKVHTKRPQIVEQLYAIVIECRQATLDAGDRLLAAMSPEGRIELDEWVREARTGVSVSMSKEDMKYFRLPR